MRQIVDRHRREPTYRPITIVQDATLAQVAAIRARRLDFELPDIVVEQVPTRRYPEAFAAHLFGYVGEVSDAQVTDGDGLKSGDIVGQAGIEKIYNAMLMGEDGARRVVVNSLGPRDPHARRERAERRQARRAHRRLRPAEGAGRRLQGVGVQRRVGHHGSEDRRGARVHERARRTIPTPLPPASIAPPWASLNTDDLKPLQDRAIQGRYPPGSTFKMAVATAALEEGVITPDFKVYCPATRRSSADRSSARCPTAAGHGTIDLRQAIEQSCNVYFYTVGNMVGIDKIHKWATLLGLGEKTGIDLPNETQGLVPSPEWKRERFNEKWYAGETISVSIGQGAVALTPVSMAVYISTIANGGTRLTPHLLKAVDDGTGWKDVPPPAPRSVAPPVAVTGAAR